MSDANTVSRKLRMGLVGGGGAGFIGKVHATAAQMDAEAELVAGVFSSDPTKSRSAAQQFGVSPERTYANVRDMLRAESALPANERIDFVSIATPNHLHFPFAKAALEAGFHVFCEKPMTIDSVEAAELARIVQHTGLVFVLMHNYSGYPLVRQMREMVASGDIGEVQAVRANYMQGWLRGVQPGVTPARGAWKADPRLAGPAGALGDIGTHAFQLFRYVTRSKPTALSCQLATFTNSRELDDYGQVSMRLERGGLASISFSQATHGRLNDLSIEIDGTQASLSWRQEEPNQLVVRKFGEPIRIYERHPAAPYMNAAGRDACRLPGGHPEAFYEAFANVFRAGFVDLRAHATSSVTRTADTLYPNVVDGMEGVRFIEQCLASHAEQRAWLAWNGTNEVR